MSEIIGIGPESIFAKGYSVMTLEHVWAMITWALPAILMIVIPLAGIWLIRQYIYSKQQETESFWGRKFQIIKITPLTNKYGFYNSATLNDGSVHHKINMSFKEKDWVVKTEDGLREFLQDKQLEENDKK